MINLSQVLIMCTYALKHCIIASLGHVREVQIITVLCIKPPKQTHYTFMNTAFISHLIIFFSPQSKQPQNLSSTPRLNAPQNSERLTMS